MSGKSISIEVIIDNIIDKDKNEFNKKSNTEQSNDKYKISKEINGLLKGRNNEDRKEILSILLEKVNDPSQSFFDSNGNVDIDKIKVLTNNSIRNAIEKGLILPSKEIKEFNNKNQNVIESIVLTPLIINKMINNYENISIEEKQALWNEYANLSRDEQRRLEKASSNVWYTLAQNAVSSDEKKYFENMGKIGEKLTELYDKAINGDKDTCKKLFEIMKSDTEFIESYEGDAEKYNENMRESYASYKGKQNTIEQEVMKITQKISGEISNKDENQIIKLIKQEKKFFEIYKTKNPNNVVEYNDLIDEYRYFCREREITLEKALGLENKRESHNSKNNNKKSQNNISERLEEEVENIQDTPVLEDMNSISTSEPTDLSNEFPVEKTQENFTKDEVAIALKTYKEYFQDFDEETIDAISEMTTDEIAANLKEDFDSMLEENQIDDKTKNVLYVLADNLTSNTKSILLDSEKRKAFFERMQDGIINDKIKDSEVSELFEKVSEEFQVDAIKQSQEEFISQDFNSEPIDEVDVQKEFIEQHENFEIDPAWEEICRNAQAKGEVLEGENLIDLYEKYKEDTQLLDDEKVTTASDNREEKAENATDVQGFKPIDFLKSSNIRFGQVEQEQQILTGIVKEQSQSKTIQKGQENDNSIRE